MLARIKKNDTVMVISGKDRGQRGTVVEIAPKENKLIVKGLNMVTRHVKPRKQGDIAGIKQEERYISFDKVMPVCTSCNKPCRIQSKMVDGGKKSRVCHHCKEVL